MCLLSRIYIGFDVGSEKDLQEYCDGLNHDDINCQGNCVGDGPHIGLLNAQFGSNDKTNVPRSGFEYLINAYPANDTKTTKMAPIFFHVGALLDILYK